MNKILIAIIASLGGVFGTIASVKYYNKDKTCKKYKLNPKKMKFTNGVVIQFSINNDDVNIYYKSNKYNNDDFKRDKTGCYKYIEGDTSMVDKALGKLRNDGFKTVEHSISSEIKQLLNSIIKELYLKQVNIFIIRHLKAEHNGNKYYDKNKKQDTHILNTEDEAVINNKIFLPDNKPDFNFVSDLRRTRETLCEFYKKKYDLRFNECDINPKPIVLPNIHEIGTDCKENDKPENTLYGYNKKNKTRGNIVHTPHPILEYIVDVDKQYYFDNKGDRILDDDKNNFDIIYEVLKYLVDNKEDIKDKTELNIIVVTHSSTIACFLKNIIQGNYKDNYKELLNELDNNTPEVSKKIKRRTSKQIKLQSKRRKNLKKNKRSKIRKSKY